LEFQIDLWAELNAQKEWYMKNKVFIDEDINFAIHPEKRGTCDYYIANNFLLTQICIRLLLGLEKSRSSKAREKKKQAWMTKLN
jgi:hypothetical protein